MKFNVDLKQAVNRLEDAIIVVSGPALAISGIIAGIDLVTGGNMLRDWPGLTLAWAICLLLTLDFQVLNLGVRARRLYAQEKYWEIVIITLVAGGIAYVSIQMQSIIAIANSASISTFQAAHELGISMILLTWERSALVLVLIFLSGWSRETKSDSSETEVKQESISDEIVQTILGKLATLEALEQRLAHPQATISVSPETPLALPEAVSETDETEASEPALDEQIKALLEVKSDLPTRDIAAIVGRPHTTVYRALTRVKQTKQEGA
jgi:hypothetical protein